MEKFIELTPEFKARFQELTDLDTKIYDLTHEHQLKAQTLWMEVEKHYNLRNQILKYVKETQQIKVIANTDREEDKAVLEEIRAGKMSKMVGSPGFPLPKVRFEKSSVWQKIKNSFGLE